MVGIDIIPREADAGRLLSALAVVRRRQLLSELRAEGSITDLELARRLASEECTTDPPAGSPRVGRLRTEIHHVHLPKLADVGMVEWDPSDSTVALADAPALESDAVWTLVESPADVDPVLGVLADACDRTILSILEDKGGHLHRARLAAELLDAQTEADHASDGFERVLLGLRHEHLPRLAHVGLVRVEGETVVRVSDDRLSRVWPAVEVLTRS